jgi:dTDP-glucose 4,6-dehydratase/UDP-glucose 4-epimerase
MKIIIIGSKGFIGSNAVVFFEKKNFDVWKCGVSKEDEDPKYIQVDRASPDFQQIFRNHSFDICINASGSPGVSFSNQYPLDDYRMNVNNVYLLLNAIQLFDPNCKFINLSSAAVYGNPKVLPIAESSNLLPLSPYGFHKLLTEQIVSHFHFFFKLNVCSLRIFSAYGPNLNKQLFWDIYHKACKSVDKKIHLFGSGQETRDFIFIKDILIALDLIIHKEDSVFNGDVYNLASGIETTVSEAASIFLKLIDKDISLEFNGVQKIGDPLNWCADISKLSNLNFKVTTSLEEGLKEYYEWILLNKRE